MDQGQVAEFDTPSALFQMEQGIFRVRVACQLCTSEADICLGHVRQKQYQSRRYTESAFRGGACTFGARPARVVGRIR